VFTSRTNGSGQLLVGLVLVAVRRGHNASAGIPVAATCAAGGVQRGEQRRRGAVESAETVKCGRPTLILTARQSRKDGESWR
jgi:hypothetical protein